MLGDIFYGTNDFLDVKDWCTRKMFSSIARRKRSRGRSRGDGPVGSLYYLFYFESLNLNITLHSTTTRYLDFQCPLIYIYIYIYIKVECLSQITRLITTVNNLLTTPGTVYPVAEIALRRENPKKEMAKPN